MLSPKRDNVAAKHFLQLALWRSAVRPRVINVDGHPAYAHAVSVLKKSGELGPRCRCRPVPYPNNIVEQDHRFIKKRIAACLWFRSVQGAVNTIAGYESMHMIKKGQVRWLRIASLHIEEVLTAPRSPWQNPYAERLIGSIRRDCLNHFVILNARHLKRTLASYFAYYHGSRTHLGLDKQCPIPRQVSSMGRIIEIPQLGGLHHRYERVAG